MNTSIDTNRFTAEGDPAVEQAIADMLRRLADDIRRLADSDHVAIYLGGGYGRGEGGVLIFPTTTWISSPSPRASPPQGGKPLTASLRKSRQPMRRLLAFP